MATPKQEEGMATPRIKTSKKKTNNAVDAVDVAPTLRGVTHH